MMKKTPTVFLIGFVFLAGLVLIPFVGVQGQTFRWQNYAGVYETPTPGPGGATLLIDFTSGVPGSFFTLTGFGYIPDTNASIKLNGVQIGTIQASSNGELQFILSTSNASLGRYDVLVGQGASLNSADTTFKLIPVGEQHPLTGGGTVFNVPQGLAIDEAFLPFIHR